MGKPVSLQVQPANTVDLHFGLIADWEFDETNGVAAADSSGRTNTASLINYAGDDSQWVSGRIGGALNFNILAGGALDPVHDNYAVTDGTIRFDNQDEFSFSYWIKRTEQDSGTFPRVITPFGETHWVLWGQGQGTGFHPPVLGFDPAVGVWEHYVVVYNRAAGTYGVYVDGTQKLSNATASRSAPGETYWIIGHNENPAQPGDYWYGMLDAVRIYNRLLAPAEVSELAHLGGITVVSLARSSNNVVISWPGSGRLQSASQVTGQWADVPESPTSPYTNAPTGAAQFFRIAQ